MWTSSTNELPLLRVITQEHLERLDVAQTLTQTVLTSQLRQIVRSIEAGAPVLPGERRVVYLSSTQCPGIRVEEQKRAFQLEN
jgi:hypothetical protein